ncbi:MAG: nucleotide exchange factor GrpE [Rubellimicrobium sp.]|nr:nucleotide exchange factor GrpE [Rubellimicrobium sp.]
MAAEPQREPQTLDELLAEAIEAEAAGTGPADDGAAAGSESELDTLRAERDDYRDRFMRALADAENARKRAERDRREGEMYGATRLARELLSIYDNLRRALDVVNDETRAQNGAFVEGIDLTMREVLNVFSRHGITVIAPEIGDRFDPAMHEAMFEAPLPGTKAGDIIQVQAEGFFLHDRLLRPAKVGVSSTPAG